MRSWMVIVSPVQSAKIDADEIVLHVGVITFLREGKTHAQFNQHMGWFEILEEKEKAPSGTVLSFVPNTPATGSTPDTPTAA